MFKGGCQLFVAVSVTHMSWGSCSGKSSRWENKLWDGKGSTHSSAMISTAILWTSMMVFPDIEQWIIQLFSVTLEGFSRHVARQFLFPIFLVMKLVSALAECNIYIRLLQTSSICIYLKVYISIITTCSGKSFDFYEKLWANLIFGIIVVAHFFFFSHL